MKKYFPILVIVILFLCGIEAVTSAVNHNQLQSEEKLYDLEFRVDVKGGIGLTFILINYGNETFNGNISGNITIGSCFVLSGKTKSIPSSNYQINMSKCIKFKHYFLGLGSAIVTADFHIENVALIESVSNFFIFLTFAFPYK